MTKWEIKLLTNQSKNIARIAELDNNRSPGGGALVKASLLDCFNNGRWQTLELQVCPLIMTHILDGILQE